LLAHKAGDVLTTLKALAQIYGNAQGMTQAPVTGEATAPGPYLSRLIDF
jgi:hypothetical protein